MKNKFKIFGCIFLCLLFVFTGCSKPVNNEVEQSETESVTTSESKKSDGKVKGNASGSREITFDFIDTTDWGDYLVDGVYRCGTDFEPGDYYVISLYGAETSYEMSESSNDLKYDEDRIIRKIHAEKGQYIKVGCAVIVPTQNIDTDNWKQYGVFEVGSDLPSGEYRIKGITDEYRNDKYGVNVQGSTLSAYQIFDGTPENNRTIESSIIFGNQDYITLSEGQFVAINNVTLTLVE
jgi:hypothetical protein